MGFVDRLRMNSIYPTTGIQPPNLNMDMKPIFDFVANQNEADRNFQQQQQMMQQSAHLIDIARAAAEQTRREAAIRNTPSPRPDVTPQSALPPLGLPPDRGDIFGNNPNLALRAAELQQKGELASAKLDQTSEIAKAKLDLATDQGGRKLDIAQQRANIYKYKTEHPNMQFKISKGGNFIAFNPLDGSEIDTGVDSGTMSEEDKQKLIGSQKMEQIEAQGKNAQDLQGIRGAQALEQIGKRVQGAKEVKGITSFHGELPTQTKVRQANTARELINTRPDLSQFIHMNTDGTFTVDAPSEGVTGHSGPTLEQYTTIRNSLYPPSSNPRDTNLPASGSTTTTAKSSTTVEDGKVIVQDKDGKQFKLPKTQLDDAKKQGYTEVTKK